MRIANTVNDSIVDGHGLRFTIFTQGCPHHCPGCHNPDTHDPAGGREVSLEELVAEMGRNPLIEGVTLSGGEPFAQAADCAALAQAAHARGLNVWTYSGYLFEHLRDSGNPDWTTATSSWRRASPIRPRAICSTRPTCWWTVPFWPRRSPMSSIFGGAETSA